MISTLMRLLIVGIAAPVLAAAQKPAPRETPWPKVEVYVEPKIDAFVLPKFELEQQMEMLKFDAIDVRMQVEKLAQLDVDIGRVDIENLKLDALELKNAVLRDMPKGRAPTSFSTRVPPPRGRRKIPPIPCIAPRAKR